MSFILQIITLGITGLTVFNLKKQWDAYQSYRGLMKTNFDWDLMIYCLEGKLIGPVSSSPDSNKLLIEKTEVWKDNWRESSKFSPFEIMGWVRSPSNPYLKLSDHLELKTHSTNPIRIKTSGLDAMDLNIVKDSKICSQRPIIHEVPSNIDIQKWMGENLSSQHHVPLLNTRSNYKITINQLNHQDPVFAVLHNNRQVIAIGARRHVKSLIAKQIYKFCPRKCGLLISTQLIIFAVISRKK